MYSDAPINRSSLKFNFPSVSFLFLFLLVYRNTVDSGHVRV